MMLTPDASAPFFSWLLLGPIIGFGFFFTGYLTFRGLASPLPWLTAFIGSLLLLFFAVLALDLTGVPISMGSLGGILIIVGLASWWLGGKKPLSTSSATGRKPRLVWREIWWALPVGLATGSVLLRGLIQPLAGFDNFFRWDYLALVLQAQGSLAHYPPVTAADFRVYPWCDGIPPTIPLANLWIYLGAHSTYGGLIVGRLLVELGLTFALVWHLARSLWGGIGARVAVLVLSSCTIFLWSISMEQETGFSGISLLGIAALCFAYHRTPALHTAIWAGLTAAFGALTRDYNLLFIPVTGLALGLAGASRRHLLAALTTAAGAVGPWYLRNWIITGNPLFPHALGGLWPTNPVHHDLILEVQNYWSLWSSHVNYRTLWQGLGVGIGMLGLIALPGLRVSPARSGIIGLLLVVNVGLWLASLSSTAGGWIYAMRVLGAGAPLLAVAAGWWGPRLRGRMCWWFALGLLPFCADAARRSWVFVWAPFTPAWPYTWASWSDVNHYVKVSRRSPAWPALSNTAAGGHIIVDSPNYFVLGRRAGGIMVPLFSPEAALLTTQSPPTDLIGTVRALQQQGVRYVILTDDKRHNRKFLHAMPNLHQLLLTPPTYEIEGMSIYDLAKLAVPLATPAP